MEVNDDHYVGDYLGTSKKIEERKGGWMELIKIKPSSLLEWEKGEEMLRLFEKEVKELEEKSSKKIEEKEVTKLGSSGDEDAVIGRVIVEGGNSKKNKSRKN